MANFEAKYNKNYKKLLIIPAILLAFSLIYLGIFAYQNGDIIRKDVSLTGGTTITIFTETSPTEFEAELQENFPQLIIDTASDNSGKQTQVIITVPNEKQEIQPAIEEFLGYELNEENSNIGTTSPRLSQDFYKQILVAILLAFAWMAAVVFLIFSKGKKTKTIVIILNILLGFLFGFFLKSGGTFSFVWVLSILAIFVFLIYTYIKNSVPSFAVMLSAFADITMTLALVNILGMRISTAGIVAFLMLIGYSVDTDILLTTRVLKKHESTNAALFRAFKTGTMMTLTSIIAVLTALIVVFKFSSVLNQIFIILIIGLGFDLLNTWLANASIIKWYSDNKEK
jgi:preprotein translocase subunit SecF